MTLNERLNKIRNWKYYNGNSCSGCIKEISPWLNITQRGKKTILAIENILQKKMTDTENVSVI